MLSQRLPTTISQRPRVTMRIRILVVLIFALGALPLLSPNARGNRHHSRGNHHHRRRRSRPSLSAFLGADVRLGPRRAQPARLLSPRPACGPPDHRIPVRSLSRHLARRRGRLRRGQAGPADLQLLLRRPDLRWPAGQQREAVRRAQLHALQAGRAARTCNRSGITPTSRRPRITPSGTT